MDRQGKILIVGDLFPVPTNTDRFSKGDIESLFGEEICSLFRSADYRICNLEGALTDNPGKCEKTGPKLYAPTATLTALERLAIDCCTLANNHITDAGANGVIDTMSALDGAGIRHLGAGQDSNSIRTHVFFDVSSLRVCLYNVAETMYNAPSTGIPGAHLYDEYLVCKEIENLRQECDCLMVVYHGGAEKFRYPSPQTRRRFHRMADSGADIVLSQHTHCIGCEEYYNGAYLLYGQGNFLFRSFKNEYTDTGLILEIILNEAGFTVKKHIVDAVDDVVRYDPLQDFSSFDERSELVYDEDAVQGLFDAYCLNELPLYLSAFKGRFLFSRLLRRFAPGLYKRVLLSGYHRTQLLSTLHYIRSEQNREIVINGIKGRLGENNLNR